MQGRRVRCPSQASRHLHSSIHKGGHSGQSSPAHFAGCEARDQRGADRSWRRGSGQATLQIHAGRIESLACTNSTSKKASAASRPSIDLSGFLLLPGMVNAHDHLEFALFPRLGSGNYRNYVEWSRDIYHPEASPVREQLAVPKSARLLWGGIRNLL